MADKSLTPERDKTLINILERIGGELLRQGMLLEDIMSRQNEFNQSMRSTDYQLSTQHDDTEKSYGKIQESITRYRADMISLVHEQDQMSARFKELSKEVNKTVFSLEHNNKRLEDLEARLKASEKATRDHFEASQKHAETLPKEFADVRQNVSRLHADTEKRLGELHRETQRQLDKLNKDITRRLLILDGIDSALGTLLIRTAPPEKKPLLIVRVFHRIGVFFRIKLPLFFRGIYDRLKD